MAKRAPDIERQDQPSNSTLETIPAPPELAPVPLQASKQKVVAGAAQGTAEFICEVCFERRSDRLPLNELKTGGNGNVLRQNDCGHGICRECMAAYVTARVDEQRVFDVRCPHPGCKNELFQQDLTKLALPVGVCEQFAKLRTQDYSQRAKELKETLLRDAAALGKTREISNMARLCPRCSVVLQKSEGCNSFFCICGHHFQYDKAPRIFPVHTLRALRIADKFDKTLDEAELLVGQGFLKFMRVASQLGVPWEEARDLQRRAQGGDKAAMEQIRAARAQKRAAQQKS